MILGGQYIALPCNQVRDFKNGSMVFSHFQHIFFQQELTVCGMSALRKKEYMRGKITFPGLHIGCSGGDTAAPGAKGQPAKNTHFQEHPA